MKALNLKSVAILAAALVLSAGFTACSDEPDMPGAPSQANVEGLGAPAVPSNGNDAPCTIWWTVDEGVEAVIVNGKVYAGQGSIKAKVGDVIRWEATAKHLTSSLRHPKRRGGQKGASATCARE